MNKFSEIIENLNEVYEHSIEDFLTEILKDELDCKISVIMDDTWILALPNSLTQNISFPILFDIDLNKEMIDECYIENNVLKLVTKLIGVKNDITLEIPFRYINKLTVTNTGIVLLCPTTHKALSLTKERQEKLIEDSYEYLQEIKSFLLSGSIDLSKL